VLQWAEVYHYMTDLQLNIQARGALSLLEE